MMNRTVVFRLRSALLLLARYGENVLLDAANIDLRTEFFTTKPAGEGTWLGLSFSQTSW
jgi:hypothetical protein